MWNVSYLKIIKIEQLESYSQIELSIICLKGKPEIGDFVFLKSEFFNSFTGRIRKIESKFLSKQIDLIIEFKFEISKKLNEIKKHIIEFDCNIICLTNNYDKLDINKKNDFIDSIIECLIVGDKAPRVKQLVQPSMRLIPKDKDNKVYLSKLGGLPLAPKGFEYPKDEYGNSAIFLGQIYLSEFKKVVQTAHQFKGDGILYFFSKLVEQNENYCFDDIIVKYESNPKEVEYVSLPNDLSLLGVLGERKILVKEELTIPDSQSILIEDIFNKDDEINQYMYLKEIADYLNSGYVDLQLLGHSQNISNGGSQLIEAELKYQKLGWYNPSGYDSEKIECLIKKIKPEAIKWRFLIEFYIDDNYYKELSIFKGDFNEGMDGNFYVFLKQEDLDKMNFNNTVSIYDCS